MLYAMGMKKNTLRTVLVAAAIGASVIGAPAVAVLSAPAAQAVPCRVWASPWCNVSEQPDDPMKPREHKGGKTGPKSHGNPSR